MRMTMKLSILKFATGNSYFVATHARCGERSVFLISLRASSSLVIPPCRAEDPLLPSLPGASDYAVARSGEISCRKRRYESAGVKRIYLIVELVLQAVSKVIDKQKRC